MTDHGITSADDEVHTADDYTATTEHLRGTTDDCIHATDHFITTTEHRIAATDDCIFTTGLEVWSTDHNRLLGIIQVSRYYQQDSSVSCQNQCCD